MNFFQSSPVSKHLHCGPICIELFLSGPAVSNFPDWFRINFSLAERSRFQFEVEMSGVSGIQ